jgi:Repeat of unknown function (DUF5648)
MKLPPSFKRVLASALLSTLLAACGSGTQNSAPIAASPEGGKTAGSSGITEKAVVAFVPELVPTVYRFAKFSSGAYFYTGNEFEVQTIINSYPDFRYEGPAFERDVSGRGQPVYRFAKPDGGYFYTGSEAEKSEVLANYPTWRFEGSTFAVAPAGQTTDIKSVFRLANLTNGAYLLTASTPESNYAVSLGNWRFEGTTFSAPRGSKLIDRSWATPTLLETDDNQVSEYNTSIDDAGRATTIFVKSNGTRPVLYATRSQTSANGVVTWTTPTAIDVAASGQVLPASEVSYATWVIRVTSAPSGNVIATWLTKQPCTANTYFTPNYSADCQFIVSANYNVTSNTWSTAQIVADSPDASQRYLATVMNDAGDVVITNLGWNRTTSYPYYSTVNRVLWRPAGQLAFQSKLFTDTFVNYSNATLDNGGNMLFAGAATQAGTTDIIAYRGTTTGGFGSAVTLDQQSSAATWVDVKTSLGGKSIITYKQSNRTISDALFVAEASSPNAAWTLTDLGSAGTGTYELYAADDGVSRLQNISQCVTKTNASGSWASLAMPADGCLTGSVYSAFRYANRNGDFYRLVFYPLGRWASYDAKRNKMVQPFIANNTPGSNAGYILGFPATSSNWSGYIGALSVNGTGVFVSDGAYDYLPTQGSPLGDGRTNYKNLFGFVLK